MNVESLRSNKGGNTQSAEVRIAKAAITICFLYVAGNSIVFRFQENILNLFIFDIAWTPYGTMALIGAFGNKALLTPAVTMIPACSCKFVACLDPYVYAISHPKYR